MFKNLFKFCALSVLVFSPIAFAAPSNLAYTVDIDYTNLFNDEAPKTVDILTAEFLSKDEGVSELKEVYDAFIAKDYTKTIELSTKQLNGSGSYGFSFYGNTDLLRLRAESFMQLGKNLEALNDLKLIHNIRGSVTDCVIIRDGIAAEKNLELPLSRFFINLADTCENKQYQIQPVHIQILRAVNNLKLSTTEYPVNKTEIKTNSFSAKARKDEKELQFIDINKMGVQSSIPMMEINKSFLESKQYESVNPVSWDYWMDFFKWLENPLNNGEFISVRSSQLEWGNLHIVDTKNGATISKIRSYLGTCTSHMIRNEWAVAVCSEGSDPGIISIYYWITNTSRGAKDIKTISYSTIRSGYPAYYVDTRYLYVYRNSDKKVDIYYIGDKYSPAFLLKTISVK